MCESLIVVAGHDSIDERSDDDRAVAHKSVTQPKTEILKPSMVSPIIQITQLLWILMRKVACILHGGKRHADIHRQSSGDAVVEVHGHNVGANLASVLPSSPHVEMIPDIEILVRDGDI